MIYFITSNKNKFKEIQAIIPEIEQLDIELSEIQEIDPRIIIKEKLLQGLNHHSGKFIVEDTSLHLECLNGLPGPFIKWFLKSIRLDGLFNLSQKMGNNKATDKTIIGYAKSRDEIYFFEGSISGTIASPRGDSNFGWDPIFEPDGFAKTFGEMTRKEKGRISMRKIAAQKLREFLAANQAKNA